MQYIAFILGASLWLGTLSARPSTVVAGSTSEIVAVQKEKISKATTQSAVQKSEKSSFWTRVKNFFGGLGKLGWAPFSLIILAILTPPLAVGIASDWDPDKVLIAMLLTALCYIPGLIYALIQVSK